MLKKRLNNVNNSDKVKINDDFLLSALSIPLNHKMTNFEKLNFNGSSTQQFSNLAAREEIL
jgi:hypothetical protein